MARSVSEINNYIVTNLVTNFALVGITIDPLTWSKRNILRQICYTMAVGQALVEQLQDAFLQNVETVLSKSAAATTLWLQDKMFKFQYDATTPQILQLIDGAPQYPIVDDTKRIITACSVKTTFSNQVKIKVAKSSPFVALSTEELNAAQSYVNIIGTAGITYFVSSDDADRIYIKADIWYQGLYSSVIQDNVITALNNFFQNASIKNFDGSLKISDIEETIRNVSGVNDVVLVNVRARQSSDIFGDGSDLVLDQTVISRAWGTVAGYAIQEDTAGKTFADSLNFISE